MRLHPARRPKGKNWLYCRLCDVEIPASDQEAHDASEPHRSLAAAFLREEAIRRLVPYSCPGWNLSAPDAAMLDNLLYDASGPVAQR